MRPLDALLPIGIVLGLIVGSAVAVCGFFKLMDASDPTRERDEP